MGGYDITLAEGEEAKELIVKIKKLLAKGYDKKYPPSREFNKLWYSEETSFRIQFEEEKNEIYITMDW